MVKGLLLLAKLEPYFSLSDSCYHIWWQRENPDTDSEAERVFNQKQNKEKKTHKGVEGCKNYESKKMSTSKKQQIKTKKPKHWETLGR